MDNVFVLLAFSGEKLIALVVGSIVDEGKTHIRRAARTLAGFTGQGIQKQLHQAMNAYIRVKFPYVCRERYTRMYLSSYVSNASLLKRDLVRFHVQRHSSLKTPAIGSVEIQLCSKEYLCNVIFSRPVAQKLFPYNVILVEYMPVEPLQSNIDYLM